MFTIDLDNNIQVGGDGTPFASIEELEAIADTRPEWSKSGVTGIWNSFAGTAGPFADLKPHKCFRNRHYGIAQIWKAIQRLLPPADASSEPQAAADEPQWETTATVEEEKTVKAKKSREKKKKTEVVAVISRATGKSKKDQAVAMLLRKSGATAEEIVERLGWSKVSVAMLIQWVQLVVRAEIKKLEIEKNSKGERIYKAVA